MTLKYYYNELLSKINKSLNKANANNMKLFSSIDLNLFDVWIIKIIKSNLIKIERKIAYFAIFHKYLNSFYLHKRRVSKTLNNFEK